MRFQSGGSAAAFENLVGFGDVGGNTKPWYTMPASENFKNHAATAETRAAFIKNRIEPDLVNGLPIPLTVPGHAVIADGIACNYEEDEYYLHVNYGWGGSADNWYAVYTVNEETGAVGYSFTQVFPGFKPLKMARRLKRRLMRVP